MKTFNAENTARINGNPDLNSIQDSIDKYKKLNRIERETELLNQAEFIQTRSQ